MAKKIINNQTSFKDRKCYDCANSYDWHHLSIDNIPTLARCEHYLEGKYCVWRSKQACPHFKQKQT